MGCQAGLRAVQKEQSKMREGDAWRQEGVSALRDSGGAPGEGVREERRV